MERTNTIIIGAGAAGLAVGACLRKRDIPFILLEKGEHAGQEWLGRYDRLHLHTHKRFSSLPYRAFPYRFPRYPSRLQVAEYLSHYAKAFRIIPRYLHDVQKAEPMEGAWKIETGKGPFLSNNLVVAGGLSRVPFIPEIPGLDSFSGEFSHTASYTNGERYSGQSILVVGFGNSATEVALDLQEHGANVTLSVRGPVNVVPRDTLGVSSQALSVMMSIFPPRIADALSGNLRKLLVGDLSRHGLEQQNYGPLTQISRGESTPVLDIGTIDKIKSGQIAVKGAIASIQSGQVQFKDSTSESFDAIIMGTGFRNGLERFLRGGESVLDNEGHPLSSGEKTDMEGLYFCGYYNAPAGLLRRIGKEAKKIGKHISRDFARQGAVPRIRLENEEISPLAQ